MRNKRYEVDCPHRARLSFRYFPRQNPKTVPRADSKSDLDYSKGGFQMHRFQRLVQRGLIHRFPSNSVGIFFSF